MPYCSGGSTPIRVIKRYQIINENYLLAWPNADHKGDNVRRLDWRSRRDAHEGPCFRFSEVQHVDACLSMKRADDIVSSPFSPSSRLRSESFDRCWHRRRAADLIAARGVHFAASELGRDASRRIRDQRALRSFSASSPRQISSNAMTRTILRGRALPRTCVSADDVSMR